MKDIYVNNIKELPININYTAETLTHIEKEYKGKKYTFLGNIQNNNWQDRLIDLAKLVIKCAALVLIFPAFYSSYRNSLRLSYKEWRSNHKIVSVYWNQAIPFTEKINFMNQSKKEKFLEMKADPKKFIEEETAKVKKEFCSVNPTSNKHKLFGKVFSHPNEFGLWMQGVAVAAAYLIEKHHLPKERLYVCQNLKALRKKVSEIATLSQEGRYALIVPYNGGLSNNFSQANFPIDYPQHKVAICIEKRNNELNIAVLDSQPIGSHATINPHHLNHPQTVAEALFGQILRADFGDCNPKFFLSKVIREYHYGCAFFALEDCISFLKMESDFFSNIRHQKAIRLPGNIEIDAINQLPPEFMTGTQSMNLINKFINNNPLANIPFSGRTEKSLSKSLDKYSATINGKVQNHRITWKFYKNMHRVMNAMRFLSPEEINAFISRVS